MCLLRQLIRSKWQDESLLFAAHSSFGAMSLWFPPTSLIGPSQSPLLVLLPSIFSKLEKIRSQLLALLCVYSYSLCYLLFPYGVHTLCNQNLWIYNPQLVYFVQTLFLNSMPQYLTASLPECITDILNDILTWTSDFSISPAIYSFLQICLSYFDLTCSIFCLFSFCSTHNLSITPTGTTFEIHPKIDFLHLHCYHSGPCLLRGLPSSAFFSFSFFTINF